MSWLRRKRRAAKKAGPDKKASPPMVTTQEDIQRAEQAAHVAALHLQEAKHRRIRVEQVDVELRTANRDNHFADLMRDAFGAGA